MYLKTLLQISSIVAVSAGITLEIMTGAHLGYVLVTGGALVFAISTKIKERRQKPQMRLDAIVLILIPLVGGLLFPACASLQEAEKKAITQITAKNAGYLVAQKFGGKAAEILKYSQEVLTLPGESPEGCFKKWSRYVIDQVIEDPYVSMNVKSLVEMVDIEIEAQESITAKWDLIRELLGDFITGMKAAGT